jgi:hypothetical protein
VAVRCPLRSQNQNHELTVRNCTICHCPRYLRLTFDAHKVSESEWEARVELAAAYRLTAHFGWTHLINNHISLRVPGTEDQFLIHSYGYLYEQITASSLLKIDIDGNVLQDTEFDVN